MSTFILYLQIILLLLFMYYSVKVQGIQFMGYEWFDYFSFTPSYWLRRSSTPSFLYELVLSNSRKTATALSVFEQILKLFFDQTFPKTQYLYTLLQQILLITLTSIYGTFQLWKSTKYS